jgi:hypothetical protein
MKYRSTTSFSLVRRELPFSTNRKCDAEADRAARPIRKFYLQLGHQITRLAIRSASW